MIKFNIQQTDTAKGSIASRIMRLSLLFNWLTILLGVLVLLGWWLNIELLKHPFPATAAMNPATALCFIFIAISLYFYNRGWHKTAYILSLLVLCLAAFKLISVALNIPSYFDTFFFSKKLNVELIGNIRNSMAPNTAIEFLFSALALLFLPLQNKSKKPYSQFITIIVFIISMFSASGYLYQQENFYTLSVYIPMSIYTSIGFFIFSIALLFASPAIGFMKIVSGPHNGSRLVRLMLPMAVLLPALLSAIFKVSGLFTVSTGELLNTTFLMLVLVITILFISQRLNKESILTIEANARLSNFNIELEREIEVRTAELIIANNELAIQYESSRHLASIVQSSEDAIVSKSLDGIIESWNHAAEKMFGYSAGEAIGKNIQMIIPPENTGEEHLILEKLLNDELIQHYETVRMKKNGEKFPVSLTVSPIEDSEGEITGVSKIIRDITQRVRGEEHFAASEMRYRRLFESAKDGILILDSETGMIVDVNPFMTELLGYSHKEYLGKSIWDVGHFKDIVANKENFLELQRKEYIRYDDLPLETSDGQIAHVEFVSNVYMVNNQKVIQCNIRDISERYRAEVALQKWNKQFKQLSANAPGMIYQFTRRADGSFCVPVASEGIRKIYGCSPEDVKDDFSPIAEVIHPDDIENLIAEIEYSAKHLTDFSLEYRTQLPGESIKWLLAKSIPEKLDDGNITWYGFITDITERRQKEEDLKKVEYLLSEGQKIAHLGTFEYVADTQAIVWSAEEFAIYGLDPAGPPPTYDLMLEKSLTPDDAALLHQTFTAAMQSGTVYELEHRILWPDGSIRWVVDRAQPYFETDGKLVRYVGTTLDITERKLAEEKLNSTLQILELSNKDLEQFAYVANHDLQEPLRMISSFTQLLERRYKDKLDQDANDYIRFAVDGAIRMQKLLNDLLEFSRIKNQAEQYEPVDASILLGQAVANLQQLLTDNTALVTNDDLPVIKADETQMIRVFQNLIENAVKFHKKTEWPKIHISCTKQDEMYRFSVADNGIGIEKQYHDKVFVVFQRLHSIKDYPGTGIGLSICKRIIERHGGAIWFESIVKEGTTFYFTIPA